MARTLGVNIGIALDKLDRSKFVESNGKKYLNLTTFINLDELGQFGDNGGLWHSQSKEERENKNPKIYVGNASIVFADELDGVARKNNTAPKKEETVSSVDDIPF